jgi:hypothetical protein
MGDFIIVKMVTGRNFSMSGINSGHHNLPTYQMTLKSDNIEFVWYCGGHFENGELLIYFLNRLSVAGLGDFIIVRS